MLRRSYSECPLILHRTDEKRTELSKVAFASGHVKHSQSYLVASLKIPVVLGCFRVKHTAASSTAECLAFTLEPCAAEHSPLWLHLPSLLLYCLRKDVTVIHLVPGRQHSTCLMPATVRDCTANPYLTRTVLPLLSTMHARVSSRFTYHCNAVPCSAVHCDVLPPVVL